MGPRQVPETTGLPELPDRLHRGLVVARVLVPLLRPSLRGQVMSEKPTVFEGVPEGIFPAMGSYTTQVADGDGTVERHDMVRWVTEVIGEKAVLLAWVCGFTLKEIAEALGKDGGPRMNRVRRAKEKEGYALRRAFRWDMTPSTIAEREQKREEWIRKREQEREERFRERERERQTGRDVVVQMVEVRQRRERERMLKIRREASIIAQAGLNQMSTAADNLRRIAADLSIMESTVQTIDPDDGEDRSDLEYLTLGLRTAREAAVRIMVRNRTVLERAIADGLTRYERRGEAKP